MKRNTTLKERSLDFEDAKEVFAGKKLDFPDERHDYGELRSSRSECCVDAW